MKRRVEAIGEMFETGDWHLLPKILSDEDLKEWLEYIHYDKIISDEEFEEYSNKSADEIALFIESLIDSGRYSPTLVNLPSSVVKMVQEYLAEKAAVLRRPKPENVLKEAKMIEKALARGALYKLAERAPEFYKLLELIEGETYVDKVLRGERLTDAITGEPIPPTEPIVELPDGSVTTAKNWEKYKRLARRYPELTMFDIFEMIRKGEE